MGRGLQGRQGYPQGRLFVGMKSVLQSMFPARGGPYNPGLGIERSLQCALFSSRTIPPPVHASNHPHVQGLALENLGVYQVLTVLIDNFGCTQLCAHN